MAKQNWPVTNRNALRFLLGLTRKGAKLSRREWTKEDEKEWGNALDEVREFWLQIGPLRLFVVVFGGRIHISPNNIKDAYRAGEMTFSAGDPVPELLDLVLGKAGRHYV